jgi:hypothetical protein
MGLDENGKPLQEAPPPQQAAKNEAQVRAAEAPAKSVLDKEVNELTDEDIGILQQRARDPSDRGRLKALVKLRAAHTSGIGRFGRNGQAQPPAAPALAPPDGRLKPEDVGPLDDVPINPAAIDAINQKAQNEVEARAEEKPGIRPRAMLIQNDDKEFALGMPVRPTPEQQAIIDKRNDRQKYLDDRRDARKDREQFIRDYYQDTPDGKARAEKAIRELGALDKITKDGQTGNVPGYDAKNKTMFPDRVEDGEKIPQRARHFGAKPFKDYWDQQAPLWQSDWEHPDMAHPNEAIARSEAERLTGSEYREQKAGPLFTRDRHKPWWEPGSRIPTFGFGAPGLDKVEGYKPTEAPKDLKSPYGDAKGEDLDRLLEKRAEDRLAAEIQAIEQDIKTNKSNTPEKQQQLDELKTAQKDLRLRRVLGSTSRDLTVNQDTLLPPSTTDFNTTFKEITAGGPYIDLLDTAVGSVPGEQPSKP